MRRSGRHFKLMLGLSSLMLLAGCEETIPLPPSLVGSYETADTRYADRYFRLTPTEIVLGLGQGEEQTYPIEGIYEEERRDGTFYTVVYTSGYGQDQLRFYADTAGRNVRLENRPQVRWSRQGVDR